jgi:glutamine synthetase
MTFVSRNGIRSEEQAAMAEELAARIRELDLRQVRISWGDQHGILRGKTVEVGHFLSALHEGKDFQTATLIFDTTNNPAVPPFAAILSVLRDYVVALGMPLATIEDEWGPGQIEFTFDPLPGLKSADNVLLLRSAIKQICRRHGYHATFMSRPAMPHIVSSGWHLHQSLSTPDQPNVFPGEGDALLSTTAMHYLGGLLEHASEASLLTTPTVNGYKRYISQSFAPDRIAWAEENRGAMIRVSGARGDASTHLENRVGEPAANPYLYFASQIHAGLDGIERRLPLPRSADTPYEAKAEPLPGTLAEALQCLRDDRLLVDSFGKAFVDYYCRIKEAEVARFNLEVSDWEHREYFDLF